MGTAAQPRPQAGYEVARPAGECQTCHQPFKAGDKLLAVLRETPAAFERLDYCIACAAGVDGKDFLATWRTVMPADKPRPKLFVDDAALCTLFERLGAAEEELKRQFRFVLGLILMRKRLLIHEGSRSEQGVDYWIVRLRGSDKPMDLVNPSLTEQQVMDVSQQLSQILSEEL